MKPTIGRIVHYHPTAATIDPDGDQSLLPLLTHAALVVDVVDVGDTRELILEVHPPSGLNYICSNARYSESPAAGCWNWPPRE